MITSCAENDDEDTVEIVSLSTVRRLGIIQPTKQSVVFGSSQNPIEYPNSNLFFAHGGILDLVAGKLSPSSNDAQSSLDMSLILDRKATNDYNSQFRDSITVFTLSATSYTVYQDMQITQANLNLNSKDGEAFLLDETGRFGITQYSYGCGEGTPWETAEFLDLGNVRGNFLFDDQNTFSQETRITITEFMDFRMLTYLRFIASQGNSSSLVALKEDDTVVDFDLNYSSDLLALSHFFDDQNIVKLKFEVSGDFDIHLFRGRILQSETPDGVLRTISISNP